MDETVRRGREGTDLQTGKERTESLTDWCVAMTALVPTCSPVSMGTGVILRDSHGVAQVKLITGNKILRILKAKG